MKQFKYLLLAVLLMATTIVVGQQTRQMISGKQLIKKELVPENKQTQKLSHDEIVALKAKQMKEAGIQSAQKTDIKSETVNTAYGTAQKVVPSTNLQIQRKASVSQNLDDLRQQAQEINNDLRAKNIPFKTGITTVGGKQYIQLNELPGSYGVSPARAK